MAAIDRERQSSCSCTVNHYKTGAKECGIWQHIINSLVRRGISIDAGPVKPLIPDPKDAVFYQVVMEARSQEETGDSYLVTGNTRHFPLRRYVVTPRQMLDIIRNDPT